MSDESGYSGIWRGKGNPPRWRVQAKKAGKRIHLGYFEKLSDAIDALLKFRGKIHHGQCLAMTYGRRCKAGRGYGDGEGYCIKHRHERGELSGAWLAKKIVPDHDGITTIYGGEND